jgi:hypothetical protein
MDEGWGGALGMECLSLKRLSAEGPLLATLGYEIEAVTQCPSQTDPQLRCCNNLKSCTILFLHLWYKTHISVKW